MNAIYSQRCNRSAKVQFTRVRDTFIRVREGIAENTLLPRLFHGVDVNRATTGSPAWDGCRQDKPWREM